ncbi:uncharacterized protein K452DRAFT_247403 [Aplosporella prunicola CBS 121167]|uniref:ASTRA-associated protein 1 n=1 Tax=Aplosporella prunicola CBS 121167 TaxID=1176127 RepID=A0A6A6BID0_9PEZI|nr:uncharacterized protein K452DRAFT_247403 [Aplosporella prunicola CBS 121167]KAF2143902.1 hypothetical protein K452DRAFT_247403 [Aplosporella prunicola CBS 121167]
MSTQQAHIPPAHPAYILRGHAAPVHATRFVRANARLLTADADGWVVLWGTATRRAVAVWRAHQGAVLGLGELGAENFVTHGRDSHLCVWHLPLADESSFSTVLPVDDASAPRKQPWLLHSLTVNTLNFCAFAMLAAPGPTPTSNTAATDTATDIGVNARQEAVLAVPSVRDEQIDVLHLPSERRTSIVPRLGFKTGMIMALALSRPQASPSGPLCLVSAYESGHIALHVLDATSGSSWTRLYVAQPHAQPPLSVCVLPAAEMEAAEASAPKPKSKSATKTLSTKHAGQQGLTARSDGRLLATAGWDGRVRVYAARSLRELAVLKWHKEGCYAVCFAEVGGAGADAGSVAQGGGVGGGGDVLITREAGTATTTVRRRREDKARSVHWLAAGSKDGKVSLWEIY